MIQNHCLVYPIFNWFNMLHQEFELGHKRGNASLNWFPVSYRIDLQILKIV